MGLLMTSTVETTGSWTLTARVPPVLGFRQPLIILPGFKSQIPLIVQPQAIHCCIQAFGKPLSLSPGCSALELGRTDRQPKSESKTPGSRDKGPGELVTELMRQEAGRPQSALEDRVCWPARQSPLGMRALPRAGLALNEVSCVLRGLEFSAGVSSQCEVVAKETLTCLHIHFPTLVLQKAGCLPPLRSQGAL